MTKIEILNRISTCISIMQNTDNTFVTRELETISEELIRQWNESDLYFEQIRQELNYEQRLNNTEL
jgi:hypothetical protein